jgi:hypothetical protein
VYPSFESTKIKINTKRERNLTPTAYFNEGIAAASWSLSPTVNVLFSQLGRLVCVSSLSSVFSDESMGELNKATEIKVKDVHTDPTVPNFSYSITSTLASGPALRSLNSEAKQFLQQSDSTSQIP